MRSRVKLIRSTVEDNHTVRNYATGGGIEVPWVQLIDSLVTGNHTQGEHAHGGGVAASFLSSVNSTISGNWTEGADSSGGGIHSDEIELIRSTVTGNFVLAADSHSGGVRLGSGKLDGAIVSGNTATSGGEDLTIAHDEAIEVNHSILGDIDTGPGSLIGNGLILGANPRLGPLTDQGGPTRTHALLPGSPAIDAGDPLATQVTYFDLIENVDATLDHDQRGAGYARVVDAGSGAARIDIGAYESQGVPSFPAGDYNQDGVADAADYSVWRDTLGSTSDLRADGNDDGVVDALDRDLWAQNYGNAEVPTAAPTPALIAMARSTPPPVFGRGSLPIPTPIIGPLQETEPEESVAVATERATLLLSVNPLDEVASSRQQFRVLSQRESEEETQREPSLPAWDEALSQFSP